MKLNEIESINNKFSTFFREESKTNNIDHLPSYALNQPKTIVQKNITNSKKDLTWEDCKKICDSMFSFLQDIANGREKPKETIQEFWEEVLNRYYLA